MLGSEFESVLTAAQSGAEWAWTRLYHSVAGQVLGYLRAHGAPEPEDALGEVFVHVARGLGRFDGAESGFRSWVFTIAHHRIIDQRRAHQRRPVEPVEKVADRPAPGPLPDQETIAAQGHEQVRALILRLPEAQRDVMLLRIIGGFTVAEIAEVQGRSIGAVKALQRRAITGLRRILEREGVSL